PAACRAILAPCSLIAYSLSASPNDPSLIRFAPKVFVSMMSAPAHTYSWCTRPTRSGCVMFKASKLLLMNTPFAYSMVTIAPSHTSTRCSTVSRKSCTQSLSPSLANVTIERRGRKGRKERHILALRPSRPLRSQVAQSTQYADYPIAPLSRIEALTPERLHVDEHVRFGDDVEANR